MLRQIRAAIISFVLITVLTGVLYPLLITGIARAVFPRRSSGSILDRDGRPIGSELIGQYFSDPRYFWSRPSATVDADGKPLPYYGVGGTGSNWSTSNPAQIDAVKDRVRALRAVDPQNTAPVPVELVTASASGLDPDISVPAAEYQVGRIARLRQLSLDQVRRLIEQATEPRTLGLLGEPRVNVLQLNLSLDALHKQAS